VVKIVVPHQAILVRLVNVNNKETILPSIPASLGTCNFYFDAQNGLYMPSPPDLEQWTDQSGYQYGTGFTNAFDRDATDVEHRVSSTVQLSTGRDAEYVWFGGSEGKACMHAQASGADEPPNLPFTGSYTSGGTTYHPFYDFYLIAGVEGTDQHSNNCWLFLHGPYAQSPNNIGGVVPNYAIHVFSNGQSPSGLTMRAMVGGYYADYHLPSDNIGEDVWKLYHVSFSRTSIKIHQGTVQKATATANLSNMPVGTHGRIGANYNPYWGSGDPRGIMFMMGFASLTANHSASQISDATDYLVKDMYSGGSGGGGELL